MKDPDYRALSEFRYQLRRFLRFSEEAAKREGLTALQYLMLLHIKGSRPDREWLTIAELAERLQAQHHGVVALVTRCEQAGLVTRAPDPDDRRAVRVALTATGERQLQRLVAQHRLELRTLGKVFPLAALSAHNDAVDGA